MSSRREGIVGRTCVKEGYFKDKQQGTNEKRKKKTALCRKPPRLEQVGIAPQYDAAPVLIDAFEGKSNSSANSPLPTPIKL